MRRLVSFLVLVLLVAPAWPAGKSARPRVYDLVAGGEQDYTVAPGDNLWAITGRFTMNRMLLQSWNDLPDPHALRPGMHLKVSDRHIVPRRGSDGIVIDVAVRTLYWFQKGALRAHFPIGVGRTDWATPPGHYRIVGRRQDPVWHVPPSIQAAGLSEAVDATRVVDAVARAWGTPEDVSLQPPPEPAAGRPAAAVVPAGDANPSAAAP